MADFAREINRILTNYETRADQGPKNILKEVSRRIINRTPIDFRMEEPDSVGRARANWLATVSRRSNRITDKNDAVGGKAPALFATGPTIVDAEKVIDGMDILNRNLSFFLTNNIDYIMPLEYFAHSSQWTAGMRRATINDFDLITRQQTAETIRQYS